jgi:hypothetical protein
MPYHPFVHDNDQGRLTVASRHEQQSQYGLGISTDFHVTGISTFEGAVSLEGGISGHVNIPDGIKDTTGDIGDSGQLLSSTGSGLNWIDANTTNVNSATKAGINLNTDDSDQWLVFAGANSGNNALRVNNTIRVNPSTGRIGIGTEDPLDQLHIHQVGDNAPKLRMVGVSSNPELNFISPSTGAAVIKFSDDNDAAGSITYDHPHNKMKFMIGTTLSFWVSPNAHLRLFEALEDGTGQAGVAGSVFTSTGTKTAWIPQSSIAAGTATTATNAQGIIGNPNITVTDITIGGKLKDGDSNFGSSGQVLSSDGTNTQWINVGSISAGSASSIAVNTNGDNSSQFVTFSEGDSGSQQLRADAGLKYNPNDNALTSGSFIKSGGTSSQFLKADGSTDSNTYVTSNTTYDLTVPSGTTKIRLDPSDASGNDDIEIAGSGTVSVTRTNANKLTITGASAGTPDKIEEGNTKAEVIDGGTNGHFVVTTEGEERLRVVSDGRIGIGTDDPNNLTRVSIQMPTAGGAGAITVQSNSVGAGNTNIVLRSIDNNGGNWAGAEFRAENYSFKIRTTERFIFGFNGELGLGLPNVPGYSGPNYGISGQVLKSQGVGAGVTWQNAGMSHSNKTSAYTLTASDNDRLITTTSNITVPSSVFSPANGTTIYNNSASNITITPAGGVTLRLSGSNITGTRTLAQRGVCTILCVASNEFIITGSGLA